MEMGGPGLLVEGEVGAEAPALWCAYREGRDDAVRQRLVDRYLGFARTMAARLFARRTYEGLEFDDYLQFARVGLLEAVDRYDGSQGAKFETFAAYRINGAILDGIASYSDLQEQVAARRRVEAERLEGLHGEAPDRADPAALFAYLADLAVGLAVGMALEGTGMIQEEGAIYAAQPYEGLELRQLRARLRETLAALPERQRKVLSWHYLEQRPFDEIAAALGLSRGRVSQLHKEALAGLRERWRAGDAMDWSF
jgi:RNA polymerase sigma factor for flagellar operon FliA